VPEHLKRPDSLVAMSRARLSRTIRCVTYFMTTSCKSSFINWSCAIRRCGPWSLRDGASFCQHCADWQQVPCGGCGGDAGRYVLIDGYLRVDFAQPGSRHSRGDAVVVGESEALIARFTWKARALDAGEAWLLEHLARTRTVAEELDGGCAYQELVSRRLGLRKCSQRMQTKIRGQIQRRQR